MKHLKYAAASVKPGASVRYGVASAIEIHLH